MIGRIGLFFLLFGLLTLSPACKEKRGELKPITYNGSYNRDFRDLNEVHLAVACRLGIEPVASRQEAEAAVGRMEKITTGSYYEVEKLTYSIPYLIPSAARLLEDIGRNFQDSLSHLNAPRYKIKVTSVTRTLEDIRRLKKRNYNSTVRSAHQYGTTFDISWARYVKADTTDTLDIGRDRLKMVLASVLRDLKKANRCYIKHERKQGCFHITVRE